jgi:hypothetical protein
MTPAIIVISVVVIGCWIGGAIAYSREHPRRSFDKIFQLHDSEIPWGLPVYIGLPLTMLLSTFLIIFLLPFVIIDQLRKPH